MDFGSLMLLAAIGPHSSANGTEPTLDDRAEELVRALITGLASGGAGHRVPSASVA